MATLPRMITNRGRVLEETTRTVLEFGPGLSFTVPGNRIMDVSKPEWVEYIQKKSLHPNHSPMVFFVANFNNYIKGPMIYSAMPDVWGRIIISADGPAWKRTRQAMVSIFTPKTFKVDDTESTLISYSKIHYYTQETIEVLGDDGVDDQQSVTYENYKQFLWAQAVVLEALRLHPGVPKNVKLAVNADKIPGGPTIEAGDIVRWSDWQMARDPSIWGDDCGEFKPQRWFDDTGALRQFGQFKFHVFNTKGSTIFLTCNHYQNLPHILKTNPIFFTSHLFYGGPRHCPGMNLSILEAVKVIVQVLRDFELEFAEGWSVDETSSYLPPLYHRALKLKPYARECSQKRVYRRRGQSIPNPDIRFFNIATDGESHDDFSETPSTRLK
ncbi:hypothetical protein PSTT_04971 [Puccinia striiformis]|uniref:Cytochrome P450 n=1 Tax=Puccinia striiformis TaxID=27350 RepID=A0A2S4VQS5_9BASI|nr:hypothetical protein PSTT_04971 [Puccinia striiformis]